MTLIMTNRFVDYLREVRKWYAILMPRFQRYWYGNGGPVIMVQVENEYGCFGCDHRYMAWMRNETQHYVGDKAVLISSDVKTEDRVRCGKIHDVLEGSNFEVGN